MVYSAVVPMQLSSFVLCIGQDGHIELEFAINGECTDIPTHDEEDDHCGNHSRFDGDHCGDCIDLPIFASANSELYIISDNKNPQRDDTQFSQSTVIHQSSFYSILSVLTNFDNPPLDDTTLSLLRTVVLLT